MRISDWSSDVCSSDLLLLNRQIDLRPEQAQRIITGTLREIYLRYAVYAMAMAVGFWCFALLLWLMPGSWENGVVHQAVGFVTGRHREIEAFRTMRSEERRVGKGCVSTGRSGGERDK